MNNYTFGIPKAPINEQRTLKLSSYKPLNSNQFTQANQEYKKAIWDFFMEFFPLMWNTKKDNLEAQGCSMGLWSHDN